MSEYTWLDLTPRSAAEQMAIDTAMVTVARAEGVALLRLYCWLGDAVSFGANEAVLRSWDRGRLEADRVRCVRRPTGGRAVWHGAADLTYSWTGPAEDPVEVRRIYRDLHERLAATLSRPGRAVALAEVASNPGLTPGACFDVPVGGEVLVRGRKTIGSAQRVYGKHLLQHGAIALHDRQVDLARYRLSGTGSASPTDQVALDDAEATAGAIADSWERAGALPADTGLTSRIVLASVEYRSHYQDPAWTWRR